MGNTVSDNFICKPDVDRANRNKKRKNKNNNTVYSIWMMGRLTPGMTRRVMEGVVRVIVRVVKPWSEFLLVRV